MPRDAEGPPLTASHALNPDAVCGAFRTLTGLAPDGLRAERLAAGWSHENWRVADGAGARWLLQVARRRADPARTVHRVAMQRLAASRGVRVPEIVAVDADGVVLGAPCVVQRWVEGRDAAEALAAADPAAVAVFASSLGAEVARLHAIEGGAFEAAEPAGRGVPAWEEFVGHRVTQLRALHARLPTVPDALAEAACARCIRLLADLPAAFAPAFAHRDLHLPNVVCAEDGSVAAFLDFEHARFTDPAWDFVKLEFYVFADHPAAAGPLTSAYLAARGPAAGDVLGARLDLCRGLEYLRALPYFGAEFPDAGMHRRILDATERWLAGR